LCNAYLNKNVLKFPQTRSGFFADFDMKACIDGQIIGSTISGRKFAEHRGLEDAERIDNEPPLFYFSRKNKTFVV
jgi:hypothetical protein